MNDILNTFLPSLIKDIKNKELAVFVGAGASMGEPANLPSWNALKQMALNATFEALDNASVDVGELIHRSGASGNLEDANVPPEAIFKVLNKNHETREVISNSLGNRPANLIHRMIGQLAKNGLLRLIVTTNFDRLIEQELEEQEIKFITITNNHNFRDLLLFGLKNFQNPNVDLSTYYNIMPPIVRGSPFRSLFPDYQAHIDELNSYFSDADVLVVKLHGSIDEPTSMLMTTEETFDLPLDRTRILRFVLGHYHTLYLGYSGADLDIGPLIQRERRSLKYTVNKQPFNVPFDEWDAANLLPEVLTNTEIPARRAYWIVLPHLYQKSASVQAVIETYGEDGQEIPIDLNELAEYIVNNIDLLDKNILNRTPSESADGANTYTYLVDWAQKQNPVQLLTSLCEMLIILHKSITSVPLAETALQIATSLEDRYLSLKLLTQAYSSSNQLAKIVPTIRQLKHVSGQLGKIEFLSSTILEGEALIRLGLKDDAINLFQQVIGIIIKEDGINHIPIDIIMASFNGLGYCAFEKNQTDLARQHFSSGIELASKAKTRIERVDIRIALLLNLIKCSPDTDDETNYQMYVKAINIAIEEARPDLLLQVLNNLIADFDRHRILDTMYFYEQRKLLDRGFEAPHGYPLLSKSEGVRE